MSSLLKRYLLFAGDTYYPSGGFDDFVTSFDFKEEAEAHPTYVKYSAGAFQWVQIIDTWNPEDV